MTNNRDNMVIVPRFTAPRDSGPRRRAREAKETYKAKRKSRLTRKKIQRAAQARKVQVGGRVASNAKKVSAAKGLGKAGTAKGASRMMGWVGVALLAVDGVNAVGGAMRRAEGGVSGRLLDAMDQNDMYQGLDEQATGIAKGRGHIESNNDLLRIIGTEGRVNSQIGQLGAYFKEKETAIAIGSDLIEREQGFDHLGTIADKAIQSGASGLKSVTDDTINAIRGWIGKGPITR